MTTLKPSLPDALRKIRKARGLSQEAFSNVSSRTYLSSLERGLKSPTLNKLEELCKVLQVHPITLLIISYSEGDPEKIIHLTKQMNMELMQIEQGLK